MCIRERYADCAAMSGRDGSGIAMGMRIGAKVEIGTGGDMGSHAFIPLTPMEGVECLWLNKYGKRYCNEAFGGPLLSGCAGARQPGDQAYIIWELCIRDRASSAERARFSLLRCSRR